MFGWGIPGTKASRTQLDGEVGKGSKDFRSAHLVTPQTPKPQERGSAGGGREGCLLRFRIQSSDLPAKIKCAVEPRSKEEHSCFSPEADFTNQL